MRQHFTGERKQPNIKYIMDESIRKIKWQANEEINPHLKNYNK